MVIRIHQFFHFGDKWLNCCEIKSSVSPDCGMSCMFVGFSGPWNGVLIVLEVILSILVVEKLNINEKSVTWEYSGQSTYFSELSTSILVTDD